MRCPSGGDEFCGDAHGIVDRNGETQTVRFERSIDMVSVQDGTHGVINTGKYNDGVHDPLGAEQFFRLAIAVAVTPIYLTVPMSRRHNIKCSWRAPSS
jgi:hypothetical protein